MTKHTQLKKKEDWITALTSVVVNEVKQGNEKTVVLTLRENIHSAVEEARKEEREKMLKKFQRLAHKHKIVF